MLQVKQLSFAYTKEKPTISDVTFNVAVGQHVAVIGESGCGKSTLLHLLFGNLDADKGEISWNKTKVFGPAYNLIPGLDDVKLLTQEFDLMPFTSVEENVKKHLSRMYPEENDAICKDLLSTVSLTHLRKTKVKYLSGGQKQRVALAQALAKKPNLLLLDEPFSHIDQYKKNELRRDLFAYLKREKITCLFATHDIKDMLSFSDQTLVMSEGKIIDYRSPIELYEEPKSFKIASLFEEANLVPACLLGEKNEHKYVVYPNEILLFKDSINNIEAEVVKSYFLADRYLVEIVSKNQHLFAFHEDFLPTGCKLQFKICLRTIQKRLIN